MSVVVVGKNSFIAQHLQHSELCADWLFLSHDEALQNDSPIKSAKTVINCAFSPDLFKENYNEENDIDTQLAKRIQNSDARYIMLSSRLVYGDTEHLSEHEEPEPNTPYGHNKFKIEKNLYDILGNERLCILRCSNIFGYELGRKSFFGYMLGSLKEQNKIIFNMSADTQKDFMPVETLSEILISIESKQLIGLYNLGSGFSIACGDIAQFVIQGFGKGKLEIEDHKIHGQFFMNVSKLQ
ncbi:MAG: sugar nucleotide-binding protein [Pseudomonadota bacterium]